MGYRVAVVGATGNVGREILTTLAEREFPVDEVVAIASERSTGTMVSFGEDDELKVQDLAGFDFRGTDLVLSSPGAKVSAEHSPRAAAAGAVQHDEEAVGVVGGAAPHGAGRHRRRRRGSRLRPLPLDLRRRVPRGRRDGRRRTDLHRRVPLLVVVAGEVARRRRRRLRALPRRLVLRLREALQERRRRLRREPLRLPLLAVPPAVVILFPSITNTDLVSSISSNSSIKLSAFSQ